MQCLYFIQNPRVYIARNTAAVQITVCLPLEQVYKTRLCWSIHLLWQSGIISPWFVLCIDLFTTRGGFHEAPNPLINDKLLRRYSIMPNYIHYWVTCICLQVGEPGLVLFICNLHFWWTFLLIDTILGCYCFHIDCVAVETVTALINSWCWQ